VDALLPDGVWGVADHGQPLGEVVGLHVLRQCCFEV
jgi:hypothetical protein